eukprot:5081331-Prymnesium_polylepis.1
MMRNFAPDGVPAFRLTQRPSLLSHSCRGRTPWSSSDAADIDPALLKAYQSLVGALLYCAVNTRPDVAYSVGMVCRAMGKPTPELYCAALRTRWRAQRPFVAAPDSDLGSVHRRPQGPSQGWRTPWAFR